MPDRKLSQLVQRELEIERLSRLYSALSKVNNAIVQKQTRDELFNNICTILTQEGGFRMSWIGWHSRENSNYIVPVASAGDNSGYLQNIKIRSSGDHPEGRGPTGTAFREQQAYICNDQLEDPATIPWRTEVLKQGYRSSAVFPIMQNGTAVGTLSVYSENIDYFQDREVQLLKDAAANISFAIDYMKREEERLRAKRLLQTEKIFTDTMIESMPGIFYLYDKNGKFLRWNKNMELITGYSKSDFEKLHPLDLFTPEEIPFLTAKIAEVHEKGEASAEAIFVTKDGRRLPYFFISKQISIEGESCIIGTGVDISEQKNAIDERKKSDASYRTLFHYAPDGIVICDLAGTYLDANESFSKMLGYQPQEVIGSHSSLFVIPSEVREIDPALVEITSKSDYYREWQFKRKDGSSFPAEVIATAMPDGNIMAMIRDISDRKAAERALRELNESLENKVSVRTQELQLALTRIEAADRLKSAFLATMSHELRTPLNSIIGFTGIILQGLAGPLTEEQFKQLSMVLGSARHLRELINDVLDLSKIEANLLEVSSELFDVQESVERVLATIKPLADKKGLKLIAQLPSISTHWVSDRRRVEQILLNLLSNSIKFTDHGQVQLQVDVFDQAATKNLSIKVSDTGIGIKPENISLLFQPFRQIDSGLTRQHEGTGLGLAISQRLAGLLGGRISVTSEWNRGTEFTLVIPLNELKKV